MIPLDSSEALVKFDVADGRRKESIQEQQVINAAVAAVAQTNVTAARRSWPSSSPRRTTRRRRRPWVRSNRPRRPHRLVSRSRSIRSPFPRLWPNGLHGAVGYQPIIITLPEGTNLMATGVVSADRRYVRITTRAVVLGGHRCPYVQYGEWTNGEHARCWHGRGGLLRVRRPRSRRQRRPWRWRRRPGRRFGGGGLGGGGLGGGGLGGGMGGGMGGGGLF